MEACVNSVVLSGTRTPCIEKLNGKVWTELRVEDRLGSRVYVTRVIDSRRRPATPSSKEKALRYKFEIA